MVENDFQFNDSGDGNDNLLHGLGLSYEVKNGATQ